MDSGHYVCDIFDWKTETWWRCGNYIIKDYAGYPDNIYDELSNENEKK